MRIFLDTEFTGLTQHTELLSLALLDEDGREFYAEFTERHGQSVDPWLEKHVIRHMHWLNHPESQPEVILSAEKTWLFAPTADIVAALREWLMAYDHIEMWADCPAYDWVLFSQLFGGSMHLPQPLSYIVNDLATLLTCHDIDPLISRTTLLPADQHPQGQQHNAMYDAYLLRACVQHFRPQQS
ncbi:3'-5' exoribonuclease domain-containing protein [Vibrio spartinae]|uniref:3'-5' exoribonuclease Rv2179c-like domain-containing protein n=1 Tax=Vibrio spartinae TaxID=1918945 RepID=A0ABX6R455_9VIBR|nr:3'-5' exoribonuclease [Vibrio spartinae]QMV16209.1 hypothetical protein Vspart_03594 [Vibrio spartinae]